MATILDNKAALDDLRNDLAYYETLKKDYDKNEIDQPPEYQEVKYERYLAKKQGLENAIARQYQAIRAKASDLIPGFARNEDYEREVTINRIRQVLGPAPVVASESREFNPAR